MRLAVVGSQIIIDYKLVELHLDEYIEKYGTPDIIITGDTQGIDNLAEKYASHNSINFVVYPTDYDRYGISAGVIRNKEIIENATHVIAFGDHTSKCVQHTMNFARKAKKDLVVIRVE